MSSTKSKSPSDEERRQALIKAWDEIGAEKTSAYWRISSTRDKWGR